MSLVFGLTLGVSSAQAGLFNDNDARQAILDLRTKTTHLENQLTNVQRAALEQANQIERLSQQIETLRGQNEELSHQMATMQETWQDNAARWQANVNKTPSTPAINLVPPNLQKPEPKTEIKDESEAEFHLGVKQFQQADYKKSSATLKHFLANHPQSAQKPMAQYWLGNALYAQRDYRGSISTLQNFVKNYPTHPRAPDALLSITHDYIACGKETQARRTLKRLIQQYGQSQAAKEARKINLR